MDGRSSGKYDSRDPRAGSDPAGAKGGSNPRPLLLFSRKKAGRKSAQTGDKAGSILRGTRRLSLKKVAGTKGIRRNPHQPPYWCSLSFALAQGKPVAERRLNGWLLVLEARNIPHAFAPSGAHPYLYVPALYEQIALHEILAFEQERPVPAFVPPARDNITGVALLLLGLVLWHGLRWNLFSWHLPVPPFPERPEAWAGLFGLDVYRVREAHEWWRTATALTLHADDAHLLGNVGFGLLFFVPLCRRAGLGLGVALALTAGVLGNAGNALFREAHVLSLGFSTAVFAAMGSLCALTAADIAGHYSRFFRNNAVAGAPGKGSRAGLELALARRLGLPLAAGLALLGILGGGGEARTDYAAHIWGFCCGTLCALAALPIERKLFSLPLRLQAGIQSSLLAACLASLFLVWAYAL